MGRTQILLTGMICMMAALCSFGATNYASTTGSSIPPYDSWVNAATNIQWAVDTAGPGDVVLVQTGTFMGIQEEVSGSMISIDKGITLESVAGAGETVIDAAGWHRRAFYISHPNAVVRGFTVRLGYARTNVTIQSYPTSCGGGVFFDGAGLVEDCIFNYNRAGLYGGTAFMQNGGHLRNCVIFYGEAPFCGGVYCTNGGIVESCTIVKNWNLSNDFGGGVWCVNGGEVINTLVYANSNTWGNAVDVRVTGTGESITYSRVPASIAGEGNTQSEPEFKSYSANYYMQTLASPCRNIGTNLPWMTSASDIEGNPRISEERVDIGAYEAATIFYASPNGGHTPPFTWWRNAATNIADAIAVAPPGTRVIVSNGVYYVPEQVYIKTNITVESLAGKEETEINGRDAVQCVNLQHPGAVLCGFTIAHAYDANNNGAIRIEAGTLSNCIVHSSTTRSGGGISLQSGLISNCHIHSCVALESGGGIAMDGGLIVNSVVENCRAGQFGGGVTLNGDADMNATVICNNYGSWAGGGVMLQGNGYMRNCLIVSNTTPADPIPMAGNMRTGGGAIFTLPGGARISNCTIADNVSSNDAGGILAMDFFGSGATTFVENTILYFNTAVSNFNNYVGTPLYYMYSCTTPAVPAMQDGGGMISSAPGFDYGYHLLFSSPCHNTGTNMAWMTHARDIAGNPRVIGSAVDMGAYELIPEPIASVWIGVCIAAGILRKRLYN